MTEYLSALLNHACFESTSTGECVAVFPPSFPLHVAVYAHGDTLEACAVAVESALESYVLWAMQTGQPLPEVDGVAPPTPELSEVLAR